MVLTYEGKRPSVGKDVFIAPTAVVIGDVALADGASIWYGAVIRGDEAPIRIGRNTNIQDNCTIHTDPGKPVTLGDYVTVGHNAVVHGCTVEDRSLVGIGAVVLNGAHIRKGSVIAAGAVVREGQTVGPHHLVAGTPAQFKKDLGEGILEVLEEPAKVYLDLARNHRAIETGEAP